MKIEISGRTIHSELARRVEEVSGQNLFACYQCGNCTAGCPVSFAMDLGPHQVIRYTLLGLESEVLESNTFWICASCLQCTSRCPKGLDIARIMEALRVILLRKKERLDRIDVRDLTDENIERTPQIAFISGFRKFLS